MVVVTRQYVQSSSSFFSRHEKKKQITESVFYYLKYPNTRGIIKSESNHLVHFLADKIMLVFDRQRVSINKLNRVTLEPLHLPSFQAQGQQVIDC